MAALSWVQFWRINAVTIAILLAVVSLIPDPDSLRMPINWSSWIAAFLLGDPTSGDKVAHFLAYGTFGFFTTLGYVERPMHLVRFVPVVLLYGAVLEVLQAMGGARTGDVYDLVANALGAFSGVAGAFMIRHLFAHFSIHLRTPIVR